MNARWNCTLVEKNGKRIAKVDDYSPVLLHMEVNNEYEKYIIKNRIAPEETARALRAQFPELVGCRVVVCTYPPQGGYGETI